MDDPTNSKDVQRILDSGKRRRKHITKDEQRRFEVFWDLVQEQDALMLLAIEKKHNRHDEAVSVGPFVNAVRQARNNVCGVHRIGHTLLLDIEAEGLDKGWLGEHSPAEVDVPFFTHFKDNEYV